MSKTHKLISFAVIIILIPSFSLLYGQSMLANPSFEVTGTGGNIFAGWNQFGIVASDSESYHGNYAARVSGPNDGDWS